MFVVIDSVSMVISVSAPSAENRIFVPFSASTTSENWEKLSWVSTEKISASKDPWYVSVSSGKYSSRSIPVSSL